MKLYVFLFSRLMHNCLFNAKISIDGRNFPSYAYVSRLCISTVPAELDPDG